MNRSRGFPACPSGTCALLPIRGGGDGYTGLLCNPCPRDPIPDGPCFQAGFCTVPRYCAPCSVSGQWPESVYQRYHRFPRQQTQKRYTGRGRCASRKAHGHDSNPDWNLLQPAGVSRQSLFTMGSSGAGCPLPEHHTEKLDLRCFRKRSAIGEGV